MAVKLQSRVLFAPMDPISEYSPLRQNRGMLEQLEQLQTVFEGMLTEIRAFKDAVTDPEQFLGEIHFQGDH